MQMEIKEFFFSYSSASKLNLFALFSASASSEAEYWRGEKIPLINSAYSMENAAQTGEDNRNWMSFRCKK